MSGYDDPTSLYDSLTYDSNGLTATYDDVAGRMIIAATNLAAANPDVAYVTVRRPGTPTSPFIRGGDHVPVSDGAFLISDYEFPSGPGPGFFYRVSLRDASDNPITFFLVEARPAVNDVWLKSIKYPFLNRKVTVVDFSGISMPARGGLINVLGRNLPVAISEVRGSRQWSLLFRSTDAAEREALETFFSFGDTVLVQAPYGADFPTGNFFVGDVSTARVTRHDSAARTWSIALTECAAPDDSIVGYSVTWAGIVAAFDTWDDVATSFPTWLDVVTYVSDPDSEVA